MAVKAPFNYIGNKYRIINSIQAYFPNVPKLTKDMLMI